MKKIYLIMTILITSILLVSCLPQKKEFNEDITQYDSIKIIKNPKNAVTYIEESKSRDNDDNYQIYYKAKINSMMVEDVKVQANDITSYDNYSVIAYNTAGDDVKGAIQIIDISNPNKPVVDYRITFSSHEINAIEYNKNTDEIIFGGITKMQNGNTEPIVGKIDLSNINAENIVNSIRYVNHINNIESEIIFDEYNVVTSIVELNSNIFVSIAKKGGLIKLDSNLNHLKNSKDFQDIKDMKISNQKIYALSGEKGVIYQINSDLSLSSEINSKVFDTDGKATLEIIENGTFAYSLGNNGFEVQTLNPIDETNSKFEENNYTVNSISYDPGLILASYTNGTESGFKIYYPKLIVENGEIKFKVENVGSEIFTSDKYGSEIKNASPNFVYVRNYNKKDGLLEYTDKYAFAAAGNAGVLFYSIKYNYEVTYTNLEKSKDYYTNFNNFEKISKKIEFKENISNVGLNFIYLEENSLFSSELGIFKHFEITPTKIEEIDTKEYEKSIVSPNISRNEKGIHLKMGSTFSKSFNGENKYLGIYIIEDGFISKNNMTYTSVDGLNSDNFDIYYDKDGNDGKGQLIFHLKYKNILNKNVSFILRFDYQEKPLDEIINIYKN
jgi:hypothetical protein